mmetsp:Transcript_125633/g.313955  ORF Transcript_125633/g.313955 Transcript_125633/m.313955 type:complete len:598 (+) Transcript_125633:161-1954(+)
MLPPTAASAGSRDPKFQRGPGSEGIPEVIYEAPNIKWYPNAEQHPSIIKDKDKGLRFDVRKVPPPPPAPPNRGGQKPTGSLTVNVVGAFELPRAAEPSSYRVAAYYQSEVDTAAAEARKSPPQAGVPTQGRKTKEDCTFNTQIRVPFNTREQFVKVGVFRVALPVDVLVGEATLAVADPGIEEENEYGLMLNFEEQGVMLMSARLPRDDDPPEEPPLAAPAVAAVQEPPLVAAAAVGAEAAPAPPFSGSTEPDGADMGLDSAAAGQAPAGVPSPTATSTPDGRWHYGEVVEVFSTSGGGWVPAQVIKIEGAVVTLEYGIPPNTRNRVVDTSAADVGQFLRKPQQRETVAGDSFFAGLAEKQVVQDPSRQLAHIPEQPEGNKGQEEEDEEDSEEGSSSSEESTGKPEKVDTGPPVYVAPPRYVGTIPYDAAAAAGGQVSAFGAATPGAAPPAYFGAVQYQTTQAPVVAPATPQHYLAPGGLQAFGSYGGSHVAAAPGSLNFAPGMAAAAAPTYTQGAMHYGATAPQYAAHAVAPQSAYGYGGVQHAGQYVVAGQASNPYPGGAYAGGARLQASSHTAPVYTGTTGAYAAHQPRPAGGF